MRFAGDGPGQQRLAGARRADQQNSFGDFCSERLVPRRILEEVDDLLQLVLGFVAAGHVVEADAGVFVGNSFALLLPMLITVWPIEAHPPREEVPDPHDKQERQNPDK